MDQKDKNTEDIMWVAMTRNGSQAAFTNLVDKYERPIYNLCYHMLHDAAEAEDAAQEVFLRAYTKLHTFDEQRKFSTWLYSIASHYCLDQLKRSRYSLISLEDFIPDYYLVDRSAKHPETELLRKEQQVEIYQLLTALSPHYRMAIILKYWQRMSCQEIAGVLDTSVEAIKSILFRARRKMAQVHSQQPDHPVATRYRNVQQVNFGMELSLTPAEA